MSIERCDQHDRHWDSDKMESCPVCAYSAAAEYQLAERILRDCDPTGPDGEKVILARAYMAANE